MGSSITVTVEYHGPSYQGVSTMVLGLPALRLAQGGAGKPKGFPSSNFSFLDSGTGKAKKVKRGRILDRQTGIRMFWRGDRG